MAGPAAAIEELTEVVLRLLVLAVVLYATASVVDIMVFDGTLPVV